MISTGTAQLLPIEALQRECEERNADRSAAQRDGIFLYDISKLFEKLDEVADLSDAQIAELEAPYVGRLDGYRRGMKIYQEVLRNPASFADLVTWAFKRDDGVSDAVADHVLMRGRGRVAHGVFSRLRRIPGQSEDGCLDPTVLRHWVEEVRRICQ